MWLLDHLLARFRWYRRMRGGHWEQWWIDMPIAATVIMQNSHGTRPGLGVVRDWCEDYTPPPPQLTGGSYRVPARVSSTLTKGSAK